MSIYVVGAYSTEFIGKFHPRFIWKGHPDYGKRENPTLEEYILEAVEGVLREAQLEVEQVERGYVGNFAGELFASQGHLGALLAQYPGLARRPFMRVEGACASGGLAVMAAIEALRSGSANVVLVVGAEVQTTVNAKQGADYLARAAHYATQRSLDPFTFPCLFARRTKAVLEETPTTFEDLALVVEKAYRNANLNPKAHMHTVKVSREDALASGESNPFFLTHPEYKSYLKVKDCSQVSDGASALILANERGMEQLRRTPQVQMVGWAYLSSPLKEASDPLRLETTYFAAKEAYQMAGISPKEVQVAEVHDCFSVSELLMYEALQFADFGEGYRLIREGKTALGGALPVNPGGGLLAFGHPVGATGVKQVAEIARQMLGKCGKYQISPLPKYGIAANMGGDDRTAVVSILARLE
ncbi:MAG: hypothetical protein D6805_07975 [Planctomycetota bacterium]|nr:MAG: hypothetical protein D6805_07975 [Planctomycetota bacterium]